MAQSSNLGEIHQAAVAPGPEIDRESPNHFLNYWEQLVLDDRDLHSNVNFGKAAEKTQTRLQQLDSDLEHYAEEEAFGGMETVVEWYERLGSLNQMEGAKESLERAAHIAVRELEDGTYVEQYPTSRLQIICGNIFQELLILNGRDDYDRDTERSAELAEAATHFYEAAIDEEDDDILNTRIQRALQGALDVEYELLHQKWPLVPVRHNSPNFSRSIAHERYRRLLEKETDIVLSIIEAHDEKIDELEGERQAEWDRDKNRKRSRALGRYIVGTSDRTAGALLEWFAPLVYRYALHRSHQEETATIRRSLHREEEPRFKATHKKARDKPDKKVQTAYKQSIDAVSAHYENGYFVETVPYQYKLGSAERYTYLPQIQTLDNYRQRIEAFMLDDFTGRNTPKDFNPRLISWFKKACDFMQQNLDKTQFPAEDERERTMFEDFVDLIQTDLEAA